MLIKSLFEEIFLIYTLFFLKSYPVVVASHFGAVLQTLEDAIAATSSTTSSTTSTLPTTSTLANEAKVTGALHLFMQDDGTLLGTQISINPINQSFICFPPLGDDDQERRWQLVLHVCERGESYTRLQSQARLGINIFLKNKSGESKFIL